MNEQNWNWNDPDLIAQKPETNAAPPAESIPLPPVGETPVEAFSAPQEFVRPAQAALFAEAEAQEALKTEEAAPAAEDFSPAAAEEPAAPTAMEDFQIPEIPTAEEAVPAPEAAPAEEPAPAQSALPAEQAVPSPEISAAEEAAPAPQSPSAPVYGSVTGEYHYGPAQQNAREYTVYRPPYTAQSYGGYAASNIPGTAGNPYGSTPGSFATPRPRTGYAVPDYTQTRTAQTAAAVPPAPSQPVQKKKKARLWWIAPLVILALLIGIAGGIACSHILRANGKISQTNQDTTASMLPPTQNGGDLTGRIIVKQTEENYVSPGEIYQTYAPSVVGIVNDGTTTNIWGQETPIASSGTGFIISEDGYILTNYHVVEGAKTLTVTLYNRIEYPAQLVGYEKEICDVALLKIDATGLTPVVFGDSDAAMVGEEVSTIGNPLGELTFSMTVGHLSAKERAISDSSSKNPIGMLQTDAAINSGNSGGPLFDCTGAVIGIVTAKYSGETSSGASMEGLGFAIPINTVKNMLDDLQTLGYAAHRAYLGVRVGDSSEIRDQDLPHGAYISSVESGYCAEKAGLKAGDVIVGMDTKTIASFSELVTAMQGYTAGQTVAITVYRNGEYLTLNLTFDARPQNLD